MAKLMCVASDYCEENLDLLITHMERSEDPITRSNAVIALGDMAVCFNHLIDANTDYLYSRLSDLDVSVKRTCLMTLTFLILAGQVKVKGQLGEMAKCLEDSDRRISDLARMFFTELATKDNAVYNQFVDMFSVLSADENLSEESLKRILKFLASFVEKVSRANSSGCTIEQDIDYYDNRINMPSNSLTSLLRGCRNAIRKRSGATLLTLCHFFSTKTKRFKQLWQLVLGWYRRTHELGVSVFVAFALDIFCITRLVCCLS